MNGSSALFLLYHRLLTSQPQLPSSCARTAACIQVPFVSTSVPSFSSSHPSSLPPFLSFFLSPRWWVSITSSCKPTRSFLSAHAYLECFLADHVRHLVRIYLYLKSSANGSLPGAVRVVACYARHRNDDNDCTSICTLTILLLACHRAVGRPLKASPRRLASSFSTSLTLRHQSCTSRWIPTRPPTSMSSLIKAA